MSTSFKTEGIVLKRLNLGETDRLVTLYTKSHGKMTVLAKGVRKLTSPRASCLEPATQAEFFCVERKSLNLLTQTRLLHSYQVAYSLASATITFQLLEIVDILSAEYQENEAVFDILQTCLSKIESKTISKSYLLEQIRLILQALGFTFDKAFSEPKLKAYIESLAQKHLRTKSYFSLS